MYGLRKSAKPYNPSPNPVSISKEILCIITNENYVVAEKTDGVRYMLVLCSRDNDNKHVAAMIDRKCQSVVPQQNTLTVN